MRRRTINHSKARAALVTLVALAALGGGYRLVSDLVTPAPPAPVTVQVTGPDYAGYDYATNHLGVFAPSYTPGFLDNLCTTLRAGYDTAGAVRGALAGFALPYDYDDATLLAIAGDAKAFVCYR